MGKNIIEEIIWFYKLLIFSIKLTWLYWFYNGLEDYSICHLNWQCSGYNILIIFYTKVCNIMSDADY
jgi:hypothetical protein